MDGDEEDYVFCGTPIEREEEITSRKKKALAESSGQLRTLPPWKQEVRDEEGRRRFHGAFTGGYSAGYYNTVGSKEGWTPQSFTSSRKSRAEVKQQSILNFLDDDEKTELEGNSLSTSSQFDTFGFTATEVARKQAEKEQHQRPSVIPGPVPDELVLPVTESIGMKLLLKMGWRHGRSIRDSRTNSLYDARREARKAFLALSSDDTRAQPTDTEHVKSEIDDELESPVNNDFNSSESTPVYVLNPKQDLHGLGYDPYKHAPEFMEKKKLRMSGKKERGYQKSFGVKDNLFAFKSEKVAPGFGIGALEEFDAEDEDVYASGYDFEGAYVQEVEEPSISSIDHKKKLERKEKGVLPGFKVASDSETQMERFDPPVIPRDFVPQHKFTAPLQAGYKYDDPGPPEVSPPEDSNLKVLIEGVATLVARCGRLFEDLSREKNKSNPLFSFLTEGNGHDYYERRLWEERQKHVDRTKQQVDEKSFQSAQKLTADSRGKVLGEKPLERSSKDSSTYVASADMVQLQQNLTNTFTKPASHTECSEVAKPFKDDPAMQERFELFMKEKYQGGLRSTNSGRASNMSEAARARERLDFEAAAEAIEKGKWGKDSSQIFKGILPTAGMQFTSGGAEVEAVQAEDLTIQKHQPKREEFQWRPSPILCKRFDIIDPYMGKPPPPPRMKSKMDSLVFTFDSGKATEAKQAVPSTGMSAVSLSDARITNNELAEQEANVDVEVENVERPVDLYKAIFSDDSDNEEEESSANRVEDPQKKNEIAHVTLNRLIAGDFLESLGKELGLEVPPDVPCSTTKPETAASSKEIASTSEGAFDMKSFKDKSPSSVGLASMMNGPSHGLTSNSKFDELERTPTVTVGKMECFAYGNDAVKPKLRKMAQEDKNIRTSGRPSHSRTSSSEDERSRKRSRKHRHRSSSLDSDSSGDSRDRCHSKSRRRKKESSREKSGGSRRHSKHHKHKSRDSRSRSSHCGSDKELVEAKKDRHKWRD